MIVSGQAAGSIAGSTAGSRGTAAGSTAGEYINRNGDNTMHKYIIYTSHDGRGRHQVAVIPASNPTGALMRFGRKLPKWSYRFRYAYFATADGCFIGTDAGYEFYAIEY